MFQLTKTSADTTTSNNTANKESPQDSLRRADQREMKDTNNHGEEDISSKVAPSATAPKKKRARGRRRKPKSAGGSRKVEPIKQNKKSQQAMGTPSKKQHDAPMKKRDLYFSLSCSMVGIKGGALVVARVVIVNWDLETVLDTFVHVPVPVADFLNSGVSPNDIRKSKSNTKAVSFSSVRQSVEQILRGKILIGHQLSEKLTALGLTHPSTDVRDTSVFFKDVNLRSLSQIHLERELSKSGSADLPLESCAAALDLYKAFRMEWEQDLIQRAQNMPPRPMYNTYPMNDQHQQGRPRFPSHEMVPPNALMQSHNPQGMPPTPTQYNTVAPPPHSQIHPQEENNSWFVRSPNHPNVTFQQTATTPVLSSKAMQALSSYDYSPYDAYEHGSTTSVTYDSATMYASSNGYTGSLFDGSSAVSDSVATASVASHESFEAPPRSSSSWFRFGSRKPSSPSSQSPARYPQQQMRKVEHMSALCEEEPDDGNNYGISQTHSAVQGETRSIQNPSTYESPRYFTSSNEPSPVFEDSSRQKWFGFRRSKSPNSTPTKQEKFEEDGVFKMSPVEIIPELASSSQEESSSSAASSSLPTVDIAPTALFPDFKGSNHTDTAEHSNITEQDIALESAEKSSSSWFSFRRSKSPSHSKRESSALQEGVVTELSNHQPSPSDEGEDWLQEVMDRKPAAKEVTFSKSSKAQAGIWRETELVGDTIAETAAVNSSSSSSKLFRFLRPSKPAASLKDSPDGVDGMDQSTLPASSFDDAESWIGQILDNSKDSSYLVGGWTDNGPRVESSSSSSCPEAPNNNDTGNSNSNSNSLALFFPPARSRFPTESTIPTVATEDIEEEEEEEEEEGFSPDLLEGIEQNLAFLNI